VNTSTRRWVLTGTIGFAALILLTAGGQYQARPLPELAPPVKIMADWQPIAVEIGHAAPFVWDINHDGLKDLMVGQFGSGKTSGRCRVYLNVGSDAEPWFDDFYYLQAAREDAFMKPS
jgi:hypothetical protein